MKPNQTKTTFAAAIALAAGAVFASAADCDRVGEKTTAAIEKNPSEMLVVVSDMISKNEGCICEIVKAAIESTGGDKDQVREIVVTAVSASATKAAEITECALAAAPGAAAEIRAGLGEVFEGGEAYSAKGKQVMVEETTDFAPDPVAVSGVYLIAPVAPSAAALGVDQGLSDADLKRLKRLERLTRDLTQKLNDRRRPGGGGNSGGGQTPTN
jgi:hypothetical protein